MAEGKIRQYEAMFLFGAGAATELEKAQDLCRSMIERHGGTVQVLKKWDERKLAYEVEGQKRGVYIIAYFTATGETIAPIERDVKLSEEVLRVLITNAEHLNAEEMASVEPQPVVRAEERPSWDRPDRDSRDSRDSRGDRGDRSDSRPPRGRRDEDEAAMKD